MSETTDSPSRAQEIVDHLMTVPSVVMEIQICKACTIKHVQRNANPRRGTHQWRRPGFCSMKVCPIGICAASYKGHCNTSSQLRCFYNSAPPQYILDPSTKLCTLYHHSGGGPPTTHSAQSQRNTNTSNRKYTHSAHTHLLISAHVSPSARSSHVVQVHFSQANHTVSSRTRAPTRPPVLPATY